ncbi:response regulator transcription factor [Phycicoccus sp.]|uniref:response regulator transcription factor n=1 Tax=Phycicoccus sp. TaxID=1902410 RepID=UPI002B70CDC5|nr:response regulator transcription factor [Phycicoccus sp.]HMM96889.1 response regulator transcription factor [Phycicoccus sp.]
MVVVDDHRTFTDLLARAIDAEPDLVCVGAAHTVEDGLALVEAERPDAVVMDVKIGNGDGLHATASLTARLPQVRVVVLTAFATEPLLQRAVDAGARALLPKDGSLEDLLGALRSEQDGDGFHVHPSLLRRLLDGRRDRSAAVSLTARERQVLQLLAEGTDTAGIARRLGISRHTCRGYVSTILGKLGAHSQLEAVALATRRGLLDGRD